MRGAGPFAFVARGCRAEALPSADKTSSHHLRWAELSPQQRVEIRRLLARHGIPDYQLKDAFCDLAAAAEMGIELEGFEDVQREIERLLGGRR